MKKKLPWGELAFLGAVLVFVAYYFSTVKGYASKAVLWPYCLMIAAVIAVVAVGMEVLRGAPEAQEEQSHVDVSEWVKAKMPIFVVVLAFILYTLLLKKLGLHLSNFLISFGLVCYLNKGKWKTALIAAAIITLAFFLVFDLMLGKRLPKFIQF